jgi:uroporphyrinogen-III synthase
VMLLAGQRVLVTRPQPGAARTAQRLRDAGFEPVVIPLSETASLPVELPAGEFEATAVSSANAVRHAPAGLVTQLAAKPLFAVGDETAVAARAAGFADVRSSGGSSADLARDVAAGAGRAARIAYLCGRVRLDALEASLAGAGLEVAAIETYDTTARAPSPDELAVVESAPIAAALVYSAKAAEALAALATTRPGTVFSDTAFITISERVAEKLAAAVPGKVMTAVSPDEDAMFEALLQASHDAAVFPDNLL